VNSPTIRELARLFNYATVFSSTTSSAGASSVVTATSTGAVSSATTSGAISSAGTSTTSSSLKSSVEVFIMRMLRN